MDNYCCCCCCYCCYYYSAAAAATITATATARAAALAAAPATALPPLLLLPLLLPAAAAAAVAAAARMSGAMFECLAYASAKMERLLRDLPAKLRGPGASQVLSSKEAQRKPILGLLGPLRHHALSGCQSAEEPWRKLLLGRSGRSALSS